MHRGFPFILWRSIFWELLRLVVLTTAVLVSVIAFAAAIKPLADGRLQAVDAIVFICFAIPPMMAYALPFAAGFAATLVYHRLATDNEVTAAQAGGISLRAMLAPALAMAILLCACLGALNEEAIPRFLRRMTEMVSVNMARWMAMEIPKGHSVDFNNMTIYADKVWHKHGKDPLNGATDQIVFNGFAAMELDPATGESVREVTATRADLWFFPGDKRPGSKQELSEVVIRLHNAMFVQKNEATLRFKKEADLKWYVPDYVNDDPKYLTFGELMELKAHPERVNWVDVRRRDLAYHLAERGAFEEIKSTLEKEGELRLTDEAGRDVMVRASKVEWDGKRWVLRGPKAGGDVEVELTRPNMERPEGPGRTLLLPRVAVVQIDIGSDRVNRKLEVKLELERVRTKVVGQGETGAERAAFAVVGLTLPNNPAEPLLAMGTAELIEAGKARVAVSNPDPTVKVPYDELVRAVKELKRKATAKWNERWAMAASCLVMVLTGAVTAMKMSRKQPLAVYLWTFVPALGCLVTISGGQQTVSAVGDTGLLLMWSGVAGLLVYTGLVYRALARH